LNLNPVRNGDAISNTSNPSQQNPSNAAAPLMVTGKKTLEAPTANIYSNLSSNFGGSNSNNTHHRRTLSDGSANNFGRRKYFPKLLQPPKRRHNGMHPSPSPSINSVVSATNQNHQARNKNGRGGNSQLVSVSTH
jgi:hypothetical protein